MPKIVATHRLAPDVHDRLAACGQLTVNEQIEPWTAQQLAGHLKDADALLAFMTDRVDAAVLAAAPRLRIVACALKGWDNFDVDACTRAGVWLSIVPDLLTAPTAELAIGLTIALARHLRPADALVRSGGFQGWRTWWYGRGLAGATVAVVGLGRLGSAIVERLQGFGCGRLLGVDAQREHAGVQRCELAEALQQADIVILALPLAPATLHLVDAAALAGCKRGQLLVNVGRGSVVDEAAVAQALADGTLGGYAADVFAFEDWGLPERPTRIDPRLLAQPNTVFTPHLGSAVADVRRAIEHRAVDNLLAALQGQRPPDAINRLP